MIFRRSAPFLLLTFLLFSLRTPAQTSADQKKQDQETQLKNLIDSKKFRFTARSATTMKGKNIQLSSDYFLQMNDDSIRVDLPYFGQSYTSSYGSTDIAIRFSTRQFTYTSASGKKGGWEITISPIQQPNARMITLSVSSGGYGNLQVTSNSRQPISFYGMITAINTR